MHDNGCRGGSGPDRATEAHVEANRSAAASISMVNTPISRINGTAKLERRAPATFSKEVPIKLEERITVEKVGTKSIVIVGTQAQGRRHVRWKACFAHKMFRAGVAGTRATTRSWTAAAEDGEARIAMFNCWVAMIAIVNYAKDFYSGRRLSASKPGPTSLNNE